MNRVQLGCHRDSQIVSLVQARRALTADQVAALMFPGQAGLRKAQQRLKRLHDAGRLERSRLSADSAYCYHLGKRAGRLDHLVALNWVYVWFSRRLPSWEVLERWEYEPDYRILRPDAFAAAKNRFTGECRFWFIELDRSENAWDKVALYNRLYQSDGYGGAWWVRYAKRFPAVLCVTDRASRLSVIRQAVKNDNVSGLEFDVKLLGEVRREVAQWRSRLPSPDSSRLSPSAGPSAT